MIVSKKLQKNWALQSGSDIFGRYAGGRPSKLSLQQKNELEQLLRQKENWTTKDVRDLISEKFEIEYTLKQIYIILRDMGMNFAKPYPHDYRRPSDAVEMLKKTS